MTTQEIGMTEEELREIEDGYRAATSGPWIWGTLGGTLHAHGSGGNHSNDIVLDPRNSIQSEKTSERMGACGKRTERDAEANARFIALARTNVELLCAEVRRLRISTTRSAAPTIKKDFQMNCERCGESIPDGSKFCNRCGAPQTVAVVASYRKTEGWWKVTTEGDCEGRTVREIGTFYGHLDELARQLAHFCYYSLQFSAITEPKEIDPRNPLATPKRVHVSLNIDSKTWDMKPSERAAAMASVFKNNDRPVDVKDGTYYASFLIEWPNAPEPK